LGSLRGQTLWQPNDDLKLLVSADYSRDTSQSRVSRLLANFVPALFPTLQYGPDVTNQGLDPRGAKTVWGASAKIDWNLPIGTLTSITGYRSVHEALDYSVVGDPANEFKSTQDIRDSQYSEEIHLTSASNQRLTWIGGVFYLHSDRASPHYFDINVIPGTVLSFVPPYSALTLNATQNQKVIAQSGAAFGEVTYGFTDTLKLTLGARETYERKSGQSQVFDTSGLSPYLAATYEHSWSDFTPKATLAFEPTRHFLAYATYATGFKSGGYDISASTDAGLAKPFNPEKVKSYEVGAKVTGLDGRLRLNGDIYRANYTDLQRTAFDSSTVSFVTTNAGSARVQGVELDGAVAPTSWLTLGVNYSYTDAKYLQYVSANNSGPPSVYTGNQLPYVAKNQGNVSATITQLLSSGRGPSKARQMLRIEASCNSMMPTASPRSCSIAQRLKAS
jgi:iron complex outermembrane receptor protein